MPRLRLTFILALALLSIGVFAQSKRDISDQAPPRSDRSPKESSSKDNPVDLSAPMGDAKSHPNSGIADDVLELHTYDPHRAEKDIEVGDFYFKQKNYRAAESRYREALDWKPNDAVATFKLANALEKEGNQPEAEKFYTSYLKILPDGPSAEECKAAIDRMKNPNTEKPEETKKDKKK
jgi:tetratricopeptide (TPR) repeat protein